MLRHVFLVIGWTIVVAAKTPHIHMNSTCRCGIVNYGMRSDQGGTESALLFPWMVSVADRSGKSFCGGVLINKQEVLTSARCVHNKSQSAIRLIMGVHDLGLAKVSDRHKVSKIISHAEFAENNDGGYASYVNDIALLVLHKAVSPAPNISPICLLKPTAEDLDDEATVLGWGETSTDGKEHEQALQMLTLPLEELDVCEKAWKKKFQKSETLCMGNKGHNICVGDYGGPLQTDHILKAVKLIGIASTSGPACGDDLQGLYTNFEHFRSWVKTNSKLYSKCY